MNEEEDNKENARKDTKLSEYSTFDNDEERRKLRAEYRHLKQAIEGIFHVLYSFLFYC